MQDRRRILTDKGQYHLLLEGAFRGIVVVNHLVVVEIVALPKIDIQKGLQVFHVLDRLQGLDHFGVALIARHIPELIDAFTKRRINRSDRIVFRSTGGCQKSARQDGNQHPEIKSLHINSSF